MLKNTHFFYVLALVLLIGCNKEDNQNNGSELPDSPENIESIPELSVFGTSAIIETITELNIKINHFQDVETTLAVDGEILHTSSSNEFNYNFNPYLIPVGNHILEIVTKDENGNQNDLSFDVEIKHLLIIYEYGEKENLQNPVKWVFFNDLEGNFLAEFRCVPGNNKIYTDELIGTTKILYSTANFSENTDGNSKELNLTTSRIPLGKNRLPIVRPYFPNLQNEFSVNINLIEPKSDYSLFWGSGTQYRVVSSGGGGYLENIKFIFDQTNDIYVRYDGFSGIRFLNEITNQYKYLRFKPVPGYTEVEVAEQDFIEPESMGRLNIPEHQPGSLRLRRYGFLNDFDIQLNNNHLIYDVGEEDGFMATSVYLPILSGLNQYQHILSYRKENMYFTVNGFENSFDPNMPNWSLNAAVLNNSITIDALNKDVDVYSVRLKKSGNTNGSSYRDLNWLYRTFGNDDSGIALPVLDIPNAITDALNDEFFNTTSDMELTGLYALDYDSFDSYEEFIEYAALIQIPLSIKDLGYKEISFPINNNSGKMINTTSVADYNLILE